MNVFETKYERNYHERKEVEGMLWIKSICIN